jgi:hypothetical protein
MNLRQRLAQLEQCLLPAGRGIVIFEDVHAETIEARTERCFAEIGGPFPGDMVIILKDFSGLYEDKRTEPRQPSSRPARVNPEKSTPLSGLLKPANRI